MKFLEKYNNQKNIRFKSFEKITESFFQINMKILSRDFFR